MDNKIEYIYIDDDRIGYKELMRRIDFEGEIYYEGKWHPENGVLSYFPDPSPGIFIDEEKALEIMKIIDKEEKFIEMGYNKNR